MRSNQSKRSPSTTTSGPLIGGIRVDGRRSVANRGGCSRSCGVDGDELTRVLEFRIQPPPADSLALSGFLLRSSKSPGFPPVWGLSAGSVVGRDAQGPAISRRGAVLSLSGDIPVVATENRIRDGADAAMGYPRFAMLDLLKLLTGLLVELFRSHAAREAETAFLRQRPAQTVGRIASVAWLGGLHRHYVRMA